MRLTDYFSLPAPWRRNGRSLWRDKSTSTRLMRRGSVYFGVFVDIPMLNFDDPGANLWECCKVAYTKDGADPVARGARALR